ncbi:MAG: hypothetical protein LC749_13575 [Actinobacteria bacterium]|nr:hypothetical protein [Actinomycetota bacterium]
MADIKIQDWVQVGAEVLLYTEGNPGSSRNVVKSTIARVTPTTFTVAEEDEPRFSLKHPRFDGAPGYTVRQGGEWGWRRVVVPLDSVVARQEMARARQDLLDGRARVAVDAWQRDRSRDNRLKAITALQAMEGHDLEPRMR